MTLYDRSISEMEKYGGIDLIIKQLEKYPEILTGKEKMYFKKIILYFKSMRFCIPDLNKDSLESIDEIKDFSNVLEKIINRIDDPVLILVKEMTDYNINYVEKSHKIIPFSSHYPY